MKKTYAFVLALVFTIIFYFFHSFISQPTGFVVSKPYNSHGEEEKHFYNLDSLFIEPGKLIFQDYNITKVSG